MTPAEIAKTIADLALLLEDAGVDVPKELEDRACMAAGELLLPPAPEVCDAFIAHVNAREQIRNASKDQN